MVVRLISCLLVSSGVGLSVDITPNFAFSRKMSNTSDFLWTVPTTFPSWYTGSSEPSTARRMASCSSR